MFIYVISNFIAIQPKTIYFLNIILSNLKIMYIISLNYKYFVTSSSVVMVVIIYNNFIIERVKIFVVNT